MTITLTGKKRTELKTLLRTALKDIEKLKTVEENYKKEIKIKNKQLLEFAKENRELTKRVEDYGWQLAVLTSPNLDEEKKVDGLDQPTPPYHF